MARRTLDERDRALISESIGYMRALAALWDEADAQEDLERTPGESRILQSPGAYALTLAARLGHLRDKVWPVDD